MLDAVRETTAVEVEQARHGARAVEIDFPDFDLKAYLSAFVYEADENPTNRIIRIDENWGVRAHWWLTGRWRECLCGYWCVGVHFESIGSGPEFVLPGGRDSLIELDPCGSGHYDYDLKVPAKFVKPEYCSSIYKLVVSLTYRTPCKKPGPIAGFYELPLVQFYESHK
ncbi:MAG: hypothetical protein R3286_07140 [Gammaproteobacteria bacterium]|nr:hypothetical protein [Gammaproteobacteria bacterium]